MRGEGDKTASGSIGRAARVPAALQARAVGTAKPDTTMQLNMRGNDGTTQSDSRLDSNKPHLFVAWVGHIDGIPTQWPPHIAQAALS
jgi:hypothetical protein